MPFSPRLSAGILTAALGFAVAGCSGSAGGANVATVNGAPITRAEFDTRMDASPQAKSVLAQQIQGILIDQYANDQKIQISNAAIDTKVAEIKTKYQAGQFESILRQQGLSMDDVRTIIRRQLVVEKAVAPQIHVTDADVQAYIAKNHAALDTAEQVKAKHILVADKGLADKIVAQLKAGGDFAALAKQYSTDAASKATGGDLGFFGKGQMVPAFQNAAFSQKIGAVGAPVKSPFGWHVIVVEEKKPPLVATAANAGEKVRALLAQQQEQTQIPAFLSGLRSKAKVDVFVPALQAAAAPPPAGGPAGAGAPPPR